MPAVSNTSPLMNLAIIDKLVSLQSQFEEVWIPQAVLDELRVDTQLPGAALLSQAIEAGWLRVIELRSTQISQVLLRELDRGEAEAIALALEADVQIILMDEHEGREAAKAVGLSPIGILGVLLREKKAGRLASISETMRDLREKAGFYITENLYSRVLIEADEV